MSSYKKRNTALLGVCPMGKFVFSHEDAVIQKKKIFKKLDELKVNYVTLENVLPDGMVRDQNHVDTVVEYFRKEKINALFIPHCNFGTEGAAGMIAKKLSIPTLLWGPRDEVPLADGSRLRDTLCGMFASSGVLRKLGVPFTYIENCTVEDEQLIKGMQRFVRVAAVTKAMKNMRIGKVGVRIDFFWSTIVNEAELLDRFDIQVLPVDLADFINNVLKRSKKDRKKYNKELTDIKKWLTIEGMDSDEPLLNSLALRDELLLLAEEQELDAITIKSFSSIQDALGGGGGLGCAMVCDEGIPLIDETDLHGAISSVLIEAASKVNEPSFFPEFVIRHPENNNAALLWHATAPLSLKDPGSKVKIAPPWILKGLPPNSLHFKLKNGPLTLCRFEGVCGEYILGIGQCHTTTGPATQEFYVWAEVDDWPNWERLLMEGPYIHHLSVVYDHCGDVLEEACKYIPGLIPQRFDKKP